MRVNTPAFRADMHRRLALAAEPLLGTHYANCLHSPVHGGHVSYWFQAKPDGRIQIDAKLCDGDRLLFKEFFDDVEDALTFWHETHAELFGTDF